MCIIPSESEGSAILHVSSFCGLLCLVTISRNLQYRFLKGHGLDFGKKKNYMDIGNMVVFDIYICET